MVPGRIGGLRESSVVTVADAVDFTAQPYAGRLAAALVAGVQGGTIWDSVRRQLAHASAVARRVI
jgi:hypothetical protein